MNEHRVSRDTMETPVFADNIFTFPKELASYVEFVRDPRNGFESMTLPLGLEYSVYLG